MTAGGKTTLVNALRERLDGADYNVWNLAPLEKDILRLREGGNCEILLLDYPFAYLNDRIAPLIDRAVFLDTPLDIAMARRVLRDMKDASADEIRADMEFYLSRARIAYVQMLRDVLPSSDEIIDGALSLKEQLAAMLKIIEKL